MHAQSHLCVTGRFSTCSACYDFFMQPKLPYLLPVSIVLAGAIVALATYVVRTSNPTTPTMGDIAKLIPVSTSDHTMGNPTARIVLVTYTDIDCEYCKTLHETMEQIMSEYGPQGEVAWVYRHFPNVALHPYAAQHAEAAECVGSQRPSLFFQFINALNQVAPGGTQFDPQGYELIVENLGLSVDDFRACIESDRMMERITRDVENALLVGVDASPYSLLLVEDKKPVPISGALSYESMKAVIDESLQTVP